MGASLHLRKQKGEQGMKEKWRETSDQTQISFVGRESSGDRVLGYQGCVDGLFSVQSEDHECGVLLSRTG